MRYRPLDRADEPLLVALAQQGDPLAQVRLVEASWGLILNLVRAYLPYRHQDDGISQGVMGYLEGIRRFDGSGRDNRVSAYAIWWARRKIQDYKRWVDQENSSVSLDDQEFLVREPTVGHEHEDVLWHRVAHRLVASLPEDERDVIRRRIAGDTLKDIAADRGCSRNWIQRLERAAIERLRARIRRDEWLRQRLNQSAS